MKVTIGEIKMMFNNLIEEKVSREEIANWALNRQISDDANDLEFEPAAEKKESGGVLNI